MPANESLIASTANSGLSAVGLPRVGIVCDLLQENWPSMDLVADMLLTDLQEKHAASFQAVRLRPSYKRHWAGSRPAPVTLADTAERAVNRFVKYPQWLRRHRAGFDLFHVVDHSYAHLVHALPHARAVVTCHDLDAFRCLLAPSEAKRSWALRQMAMRVLTGLKKAAWVVCDTGATADELLAHGWVHPEKMSVAHLGVAPVFSPDPDAVADQEAELLLNPHANGVKLLHVGSTIPRKCIDVLLRIFAEIKRSVPNAALVRVGGSFTLEQQALAKQLQVEGAIVVLPFLPSRALAAVYRRATLLALPSEREGFGLPVLEAMACGIPVVASDLPALREVGGEAVTYCATGDIRAFAQASLEMIRRSEEHSAQAQRQRSDCLAQAKKFSWSRYADEMVRIYDNVLNAGT